MNNKKHTMPQGKDSYNWKGEDVSYHGLHAWVSRRLGKAVCCEQCGKNDLETRYEWSNIDGRYRRNLNDYIMLCVSCHRKRDNAFKIRQVKEVNSNLDAARIYAGLSYAKRLKVGAVLTTNGHIISNGRNGTPSGYDNTCEDDDGGTVPEVVHAEANAIVFAARQGISTDGSNLITTHSPSFECCKLIIQSGVKSVVYEQVYRDDSGLAFLLANGVTVTSIQELNGELDG